MKSPAGHPDGAPNARAFFTASRDLARRPKNKCASKISTIETSMFGVQNEHCTFECADLQNTYLHRRNAFASQSHMSTPPQTLDGRAPAQGGTELMVQRLTASIPTALLDKFQIISSPDCRLDFGKIRILWCHGTPVNSGAGNHLANYGWRKFHRIIFVSNSQMQLYCDVFSIPYSHCEVMLNAIEPIEQHEKPKGNLRIGYWSMPDRGLAILIPVFQKLAKKYDNITLDVYSSYSLYGYAPQRDAPFEKLFDACKTHPQMRYHGSLSNAAIREELKSIHILAFPCICHETSCLVLIEAMSAGMLCVHSNAGSLYETALAQTEMYQFNEDPNKHAQIFLACLERAIVAYNTDEVRERLRMQKAVADNVYSWEKRSRQWIVMLERLQHLPPV